MGDITACVTQTRHRDAAIPMMADGAPAIGVHRCASPSNMPGSCSWHSRGASRGRALLEFPNADEKRVCRTVSRAGLAFARRPAWFDDALSDARSRVVPLWDTRSLITDGPAAVLLELSEIPAERRNSESLILLGRFGGAPMFAYEIEGAESAAVPEGARFEDLRTVASPMPTDQAGLLGYARAMIHWRRMHRHCGRCGWGTVPGRAGHVLVCTNPDCRHEQFPRIDPAIIVLVSDGARVLLGRQAAWPPGRYSTIAGFVEPGESLEDAVVSEVAEETGVRVEQVDTTPHSHGRSRAR